MPREALSVKQKQAYKLNDFKKWVKMQMAATGKTQADVGEALGLAQCTVSQMLKIPDKKKKKRKVNPDPFSYGQVLILCEYFGVDKEEKSRLLTM